MRLEELNEVQKEVRSKCAEIKARVDEVRAFIGRHVYSAATFEGCLSGTVDDYLDQFDSQIAKLEAKIEADRLRWTKEVSSSKKT